VQGLSGTNCDHLVNCPANCNFNGYCLAPDVDSDTASQLDLSLYPEGTSFVLGSSANLTGIVRYSVDVSCECIQNFTGPTCSKLECPDDCYAAQGHGTCVADTTKIPKVPVCECSRFHEGDNCYQNFTLLNATEPMQYNLTDATIAFLNSLSQAVINKDAVDTFFVDAKFDVKVDNRLSNERYTGAGYMALFNNSRFTTDLFCDNYTLSDNSTVPRVTTSDSGFTFRSWFWPGNTDALSGGVSEDQCAETLLPAPPGSAKSTVLASMYTNKEHTMQLIIHTSSNGKLAVHWSNLNWETDLPIYNQTWQYVAISYSSWTGRLSAAVRGVGCPSAHIDWINGAAPGCTSIRVDYHLTVGGVETMVGIPAAFNNGGDIALTYEGGADSIAVWDRWRTDEELSADSSKLEITDSKGLLLNLNFEVLAPPKILSNNDTSDELEALAVRMHTENQTIACLSKLRWTPPVSTVVVSRFPIPLEVPLTQCPFQSAEVEAQAKEICQRYLYTGMLYTNCSLLGPQLLFYYEACLCDIAKHNDVAFYQPSVCMYAAYCYQMGLADVCLEECDGGCNLTAPLPSSGLASNVFMFATLLCVALLSIFMLCWFVMISSHRKRKRNARALALERMQREEDVEMGVFTGRKMSFVNPMFGTSGDGGYDNPDDAEETTFKNPLYMDDTAYEEANATAAVAATVDSTTNFQADKDSSLIDLQLFDMNALGARAMAQPPRPVTAAAASSANVSESLVGASAAPDAARSADATALLNALQAEEFFSFSFNVNGMDVHFMVNGEEQLSTRLITPINDGPGVLRIGQRVPGTFRFEGEVRALHFVGSHFVDDPRRPNKRVLDETPLDLMVMSDNPNSAVEPGSESGSMLFTGKRLSYLEMPEVSHPVASDRFQINVELRCKVQAGGYLVAKTTPDGSTRLWALALVKTRRGMSWQFYYRPKDSQVGHRSLLCNTNGESVGEVDLDNLINVPADQEEIAAANTAPLAAVLGESEPAKKSSTLARIGSKLMRSRSSMRSDAVGSDPSAGASGSSNSASQNLAQRAETAQALSELQSKMESDAAAREMEMERAVQASQAAMDKLDQAEVKEEGLQGDVLEEAELERTQALEETMIPIRPIGLADSGSAMVAGSSLDPDEQLALEDDGPPLDRQSFLALSSLFPDVHFW
jgi:hypothetical protein